MKIMIIGAGVMGGAITASLARSGENLKLIVTDKDLVKARALARRHRVFADKNYSQMSGADIVIIAVKPQDIPLLAETIRGKLYPKILLFSIAAGVTISKIQKLFRHKKVVRIIPNLGLAVGQGIAVWKMSRALNVKEVAKTKRVLDLITDNFSVSEEKLIDVATAVSGSGPAYFFYLADKIIRAATSLGLKSAQARKLTEKTMLAAAFLQDGVDYTTLIKKIASKKGTTEAAMAVFQHKKLGKILDEAINTAYKKARQLSQ